jgi:hypothetical protein
MSDITVKKQALQSEKRPARTPQEEKAFIEQLKENKTHCYFCNKPLDIDEDKCSTEFGIFMLVVSVIRSGEIQIESH